MNLALDASYSLGTELSGVGIYSRELLWGLARNSTERFRWLYRPHRFRQALQQPKPDNVRRAVLWDTFGSRQGIFHGLNQRLPQRRYPLQIATFHDLFVITGEYSSPDFRKRFARQAEHAAKNADLIIAVSQFTANQVHELLGTSRSKIRVIHHGVVPRSVGNIARKKMVLSVGAIQERKNTFRLMEAFRSMPPDWSLVLAGSAGFGAEKVLRAARDPRIRITGYASEEELTKLYSRASIFAFPSLDEGFGMPILEAMAAGVPVITSNRSAMPEIAGAAALLVDPTNVDEISGALRRLAADQKERNKYVDLGRLRASEFTWTKAIQKTWAIYEELISLPQLQS